MIENSSRQVWIIDGAYMAKAQHSVEQGFKFNYLHLRKLLESRFGAIDHALYIGTDEASPQQSRFMQWMQRALPSGPQIRPVLFPLKEQTLTHVHCKSCDEWHRIGCSNDIEHDVVIPRQSKVDVEIATQLLTIGLRSTSVILSTGDCDFASPLEHLVTSGVQIKLASFRAGVSSELQALSSSVLWLDEYASAIRNNYAPASAA